MIQLATSAVRDTGDQKGDMNDEPRLWLKRKTRIKITFTVRRHVQLIWNEMSCLLYEMTFDGNKLIWEATRQGGINGANL
jgi:hypothetical protein